MQRLAGKVAFVTGAARGQGRSHASRLAEEGADVIAIDICKPVPHLAYPLGTADELEETAALVRNLGRAAFTARVDVRDLTQLEQCARDAEERFGHIDIVVANAGIGAMPYPAHEIPADVWQQMIDINLTGVWHTAKALAPYLIRSGPGAALIMTSSVAGLRAFPNIAHYVSAKHAVVGLMRAMAIELAPHGVRVNSVHPTNVRTPMIMNDEMYRLFVPDVADPTEAQFAEASQTMNAIPVPWVDPVDISNAVVWLCSDEARYVTGVALPIDAGAMLK